MGPTCQSSCFTHGGRLLPARLPQLPKLTRWQGLKPASAAIELTFRNSRVMARDVETIGIEFSTNGTSRG